jgi:hypothetical protein
LLRDFMTFSPASVEGIVPRRIEES